MPFNPELGRGRSPKNPVETAHGIESRPEGESRRTHAEYTPPQQKIIDVTQQIKDSGFEEWFGEAVVSAQDITDFCGTPHRAEDDRNVIVFLKNKIVLTTPTENFEVWGFCQTFELPLSENDLIMATLSLDIEEETLLDIINRYRNR